MAEAKKTKDNRYYAWCCTKNNYTQEDINKLVEFGKTAEEKKGKCRYLIFQEEKGELKGTPHLQIFVKPREKQSLGSLQKLIGIQMHCQPRHSSSTDEKAAHYCKKPCGDDDCDSKHCKEAKEHPDLQWGTQEFGTITKQGQRSDLIEVTDELRNGASWKSIADQYQTQFVMYQRGLKEWKLAMDDKSEVVKYNPQVHWIYGPSTCGKSTYAKKQLLKRFGKYWEKTNRDNWFCGYDGEEGVLFDDCSQHWFQGDLQTLLNLFRDLPRRVPVKGSHVWFYPKVIYVTSRLSVPEMWQLEGESEQILRRLDTHAQLKRKEPHAGSKRTRTQDIDDDEDL